MALTWWRSWPAAGEIRARGRAHVIDSLPRLIMRDGDYSTIEGGWPDVAVGLCLLEWDVALGARERALFEEQALEEPDRVLVAPYDVEVDGRRFYVHKVCPEPRRPGVRFPAGPGSTEVDAFGFGCIYLPCELLFRWPGRKPLRDSTFSDWHIANVGRARVTWDVHPQHLHGD